MIQTRDEIECGEVTDQKGNRWRKYKPGPVTIVIADEAETQSKRPTATKEQRRRLVVAFRDHWTGLPARPVSLWTPLIIVAMILGAIVSAVNWHGVIAWLWM